MEKSVSKSSVALLFIAVCMSCCGMRVDLSDYTDLTDNDDDSAGLRRAIAAAGTLFDTLEITTTERLDLGLHGNSSGAERLVNKGRSE